MTARPPALRIGILGCGALGGVMAAALADSEGIELTVFNTNPEIARAVVEEGLVLLDKGRRTVRPVRLLAEPAARDGAASGLEVVILATKSVGLIDAARRVLPALTNDGVLVTTQNGLAALELAEALGSRRVVAGAVLWGASMEAPGVYRVTAHGPFVIGRLVPDEAAGDGEQRGNGGPDPGLDRAAAALNRIFPSRVSDNMPGVLWSKLAITSSLTTLGAITGLRFGELVRRRRIRRLVLGIGAEVRAVAVARGVSLEPLAGGLDIERLLSPEGYPALLKHLLLRIVGRKHRSTESSMLDSLRRGRKTEIGFINARVVELADEAGVSCPLNRLATEIVAEMESGAARPSVEHLERFAVG